MKKSAIRPHGFGHVLLIAVTAMLVSTSMAVTLPQTESNASVGGVTIKNFGKINDHYYRGSQPDQEQFAELKQLGVKTVIDLRKDSRRGAPEWVNNQGMRYFNIPLKADQAATEDQTAHFLKLVNDPENWPVYVHCKGGRHRTGALTAVYRITHDGWTAQQAYDEMKRYDFNNGFFGGPSAQKRFVFSFYERYSADAYRK